MSKKRIDSSNNEEDNSWQDVKIKGKIVSDDGGGLEGLIGLEVLVNYDSKFVSKDKKKSRKRKCNDSIKGSSNEQSTSTNRSKRAVKNLKTNDSPVTTLENEPKKKKLKDKRKQNKNKAKKEQTEEAEAPGKYVRPNLADSESDNEDFMHNLESWNGLGVPNKILRALAERGFTSPTQIQALTLPAAIMGKKDILGAAETGSGKTLAFAIPILSGIMELKIKGVNFVIRKPTNTSKNELQEEELDNWKDIPSDDESDKENLDDYKPLYALILTPTRELAVQVHDHIVDVAKYTGINVAAIFGGMSIDKQVRILAKCPEIVVGTPGRIWELLSMENDHLSKIDKMSFFVIDETDRMVEKGHFEELQFLLRRLNVEEGNKASRQTFVFSATLSLVHDLSERLRKRNSQQMKKTVQQTPGTKIQSFIEELGISQPKIVDITRRSQTAENLTESRLVCPMEKKDLYLYYFIHRHPGRTIVFCNSIDCVKRLGSLFGVLNCSPLPLHANMIQKQRLKNLERFRSDCNGLLIATDVAARGLDIQNVKHVIHYQVPRTSENYVHRSGRTARANKDGITVLLMDPGEISKYVKLRKTLGWTEDLPLFPITGGNIRIVKERLHLAKEIEKLELKLRRSTKQLGWMRKCAEEMEMVLDDDDENVSDDDAMQLEKSRDKQYLINRKIELAKLLNEPLFSEVPSFNPRYPTSQGKSANSIIQTNLSEGNTAVTLMKQAIEESKEAKKLRNKKKKH